MAGDEFGHEAGNKGKIRAQKGQFRASPQDAAPAVPEHLPQAGRMELFKW